MAYQVFARKYRPLTFDQILGQDHVVQTLRNAIEKDRIAQAYLFVGPRGTGKTTAARILAKALNCRNGPSAEFDPQEDICQEIAEGNSLDVLEIDGASNNGVEQVRELRESTKFAPARGRFRIYYIDEVHMLTTAAFNALLKTLEEPPPHVKFIFATTEPNKILPTILSRCQRFDLRPIPENIIAEHLLYIAGEEGIDLDPLAAHSVARGAEGGMRDAQSMLDQLVAFCGEHITQGHVHDIFGFTAHETVASLATAVLEHRTVDALNALHEQAEAGKDLTRLLADLIVYLRNLLVHKVDPDHDLKDTPEAVAATLRGQADLVATDRLLDLIDHFAEIDARMKWAPHKKMHFEVGIIKAVQALQESNLSDVIQALSGALEEMLPPATTPAASTTDPAHPPGAGPKHSVPVEETLPLTAPPAGPSAPSPQTAAEEPASTSPTSDPQLIWRQVQTKFPMVFSQAAFGGVEGDRFVVRFHSSDFGKERASAERETIDEQLRQISGQDLCLDVFIDDDATLAPATTAPAEPPAATSESQPHEDPLIQKALDFFEATLEKKG